MIRRQLQRQGKYNSTLPIEKMIIEYNGKMDE